jgi:apolipoprotein N-acyltransferase
LYAAFPPLNLGLLAWLAPLGWLWLIRGDKLPGRRPYLAVWCTGFVYWMVLLQFMRLPHWATGFGWVALSLYLSCYAPLFVGLCRVTVHRLRFPLVLAAPVVWTGLELLRSYLFTGFAVALLGHTQVAFPALIQIADVFGAYGVSFVVMLGAACVARMLPMPGAASLAVGRWTLWPVLSLSGVLAAVLAYGYYRLDETPPGTAGGRALKVALIQGCFPTRFPKDDQDQARLVQAMRDNFEEHLSESVKVCRQHPDLDLVIWPESMFSYTDITVDGALAALQPPPDFPQEEFVERIKLVRGKFEDETQRVAFKINHHAARNGPAGSTRLLVGCESNSLGPHPLRRYNSALLIDSSGHVTGRYYKMHRVMFGEYVPLGNLFPWLYTLTPMPEGLTPGERAESFEVAGLRLAPSVCFETTMPQVIRRQVRELDRRGVPPDVLVNVTNDGWFWGSEALDLHLTCSVFRAIEQRRPLLVAANTGFSAVIDGNGKVLEKGPRYAAGEIVAEVRPDGRWSIYKALGDLPAWACSLVVWLSAVVGLWGRFRGRRE